MRITRRARLWGVAVMAALAAACTTEPLHPADADGTYCHRLGKPYQPRLTCTPGPIPPPQAEAQARTFGAVADRLTVYLVRQRWGDTRDVVEVAAPGVAPVQTVPDSFARLRLAPGPQVLTASWPGGSARLRVTGRAGEVLVVELVGRAWAWGSSFRLVPGDVEGARARAVRLRLVADVG